MIHDKPTVWPRVFVRVKHGAPQPLQVTSCPACGTP
jgi:hypothetical protein